ncbi:LysR family transcriptional regulator [Frankia sp. AgB32]|uniref:LysR family transcriptional regulator n=1 Tax=Frankia sp. AgB32 TaxID=631119 RepID=UPI00200FB201|nr:LysR family transcriptional regulator [Frankia sp. AgB32]MCK9894467.1 LysR family transcriptional regulator [Frankia sp. AgB32]
MNLGQLDLNLLVVLDALLREKNVTRAAESLHLSQPATSTALARLRRTLGDELLRRNGRYLELTPRAESLIAPVREVLATIEQTIVRPRTFEPLTDSRHFAVIGSDYIGTTLLRPLIARLVGLATGLQVDAAPIGVRFVEALNRDEVDIAILPDRIVGAGALPDCSRRPVILERFVGVVWREHPHAGDRLTADLLAHSPYLGYVASGARCLVERDLDAAGCPRRVAATSSSMVTMAFLLAGTDLVALLPERLARRVAAAAEIRILEPEMPLPPLRESAFWHARRDRDPGHVWLRQQLFAVARDEFPDADGGAVAA